MRLSELSELPPETLNYYMRFFSEWVGLPSDTLQKIARMESSYDSNTGFFFNVCNSSQACGLMQLKPIALKDIRINFGIELDPLNPIQAIVAAALYMYLNRRYISRSIGRTPTVAALVVAYNGGWTVGRNYMLTGRVSTAEASNYLAKYLRT